MTVVVKAGESEADTGRKEIHKPMTIQPKSDLFDVDCHTRAVMKSISECLMDRPLCRHAFLFGVSYFCNHPRHLELRVPVRRKTERVQPPVTPLFR